MTSPAPWLAHYDTGVPPSLAPYPSRTLLDYLSDAVREQPRAPALLFKGATITYGELEALSNACAAAFQALGIRKGDRVALLLPNCPQFMISEIGAWKIGAIVAPLNPTYTESELEGPLREHGVETIVTLTRFYDRVKRVQPRTPLKRVIATNIKEYFPPVLRLLFTLARERKDGDRIRLAAGDHAFDALLAGSSRPFAAARAGDARRSGGAADERRHDRHPKGVVGTHGAYVIAGLQIKAWNQSVLSDGGSPILLPLPLFHVYGNVGVQSLAIITRNPCRWCPIRAMSRTSWQRSIASSRRSSTACRRCTSPCSIIPMFRPARSTSSRSGSASRGRRP